MWCHSCKKNINNKHLKGGKRCGIHEKGGQWRIGKRLTPDASFSDQHESECKCSSAGGSMKKSQSSMPEIEQEGTHLGVKNQWKRGLESKIMSRHGALMLWKSSLEIWGKKMNMSIGGQVYHITGCMKTFPAPKAKIEQEVAHFGSSQIFWGGNCTKKGPGKKHKNWHKIWWTSLS